ncbi:MAG TPA: hypothetical protein VFV94_00070 [Polyangiaceae bacterium]|jgi:hypothetical protein|nr:hypothetical protein [Polyangiaceae bacterium]
MEVEYDESAWPIVVARWKRSLVDADVTPVLRKVDGWLARGRFGLLIDSRGAESLSPDQRNRIVEHMKANAALTRERLVQAVVIDNLVHRTLFFGVNLIFPMPFPNKVFSDTESARRWLASQLGLGSELGHGA